MLQTASAFDKASPARVETSGPHFFGWLKINLKHDQLEPT